MLSTDRLLLRQWIKEDFLPFAEMCADNDVMEYFPRPQTQKESYDMAAKIQSLIKERGWGFWALEIPGQHKFIGFVGLHTPKDSMPFSPCVEIGWRLPAGGAVKWCEPPWPYHQCCPSLYHQCP